MEFNSVTEGKESAHTKIKYYPVDNEAAIRISALFDKAVQDSPGPTIQHPHPGEDWANEFAGRNEFALLTETQKAMDLRRFMPSTQDRVVLIGPPMDDLENGAEDIEVTALSLSSRVKLRIALELVKQEEVPLTLVERGMRWIKSLRK